MKIGGGHDLASGGTFEAKEGEILDVKECIEKFKEFAERNS